ncbi:MAG: substrate-binding domain-containing protein [Methanomassiliicoccaceae archaeon]|nr:substrate-binding domain-containing protein [Methanomassiliicoccaceae archaeon]
MDTWMKISVSILITAMICVPVTATVMGNDTQMLNVAGSTTVQPLMLELQKEFEKFANVDMNVTGGGSGVGISSTLNGVADIGMLSRELKSGELTLGLNVHRIAKDAVVVITNTSAGLKDNVLSLTQIAKIYSGEYTKWSELGGANIPIAVIAREEGSGTRDCFDAAMKGAVSTYAIKGKDVLMLNNTNAVLSAVNDVSGSIGYVNYNVSDGLQSNTAKLRISTAAQPSGIGSDNETIKSGDYPISRDLILVTKGSETGITKFFMDWIMSPDGQDIVEKAGFVRVDA